MNRVPRHAKDTVKLAHAVAMLNRHLKKIHRVFRVGHQWDGKGGVGCIPCCTAEVCVPAYCCLQLSAKE